MHVLFIIALNAPQETPATIMADSFHWADYLVFAMSLVLTLTIGIYFGFRDRKRFVDGKLSDG